MDFVHPTLVFCTDKSDFHMYVISVPVLFTSHVALSFFRCSFVPAAPLLRWLLVSPATSPMLRWYKIFPAPFQTRRGYRNCPAPSQAWRGYRNCPAPSQAWRGYRTCPAPSPTRRGYRICSHPSPTWSGSIVSSAPVRCGQTTLRTTVDDARDTFRRSKYCLYISGMFYDYAHFFFVNFYHLLTSVAEWSVQCRILKFNSRSSNVRYIVLQLSRNLYLRHDFRALQTNLLLMTRQQEDFTEYIFPDLTSLS